MKLHVGLNNGPSPGHSNLSQMEDTSIQVPTCGHFSGSNVMLRFLSFGIGNLKLTKACRLE